MPLPSYARVTNTQNGHSMIVRVNDRGPFHGNRIIDVSERAALALGFKKQGTARVRVEYVGRASTNGSDDRILLASLRTDGMPASITAGSTMIAQAHPRPNPPRETIALQTYEPDDGAVEAPIVSSRAPLATASAAPVEMPLASHVPLPPERPFDLGTIPGAATPMRVSSATSSLSPRPAVAGLYYAAAETSPAGFRKSNAFTPLDQAKFVVR
jgi:rare lipoprotein A